MATAKPRETEVFISEVTKDELQFFILGTSPLICNRMSQKAMRELILPKGRKTAADKASQLKHDPIAEYRDSPYTSNDPKSPTRLQLLSSMFKKAMMTAALDLPGAKKAQIGRLLYVLGDRVDLYGTPQIMSSVVRSADMNRTPDVRTRAILSEWACTITISYVTPILRQQSIMNLLVAGGITAGVGDFRVEKGAGSYGTFQPVSKDHPDLLRIMQQGKEAQDAALLNPEYYDDETETLLGWFAEEVKNRGHKAAAAGGGQ